MRVVSAAAARSVSEPAAGPLRSRLLRRDVVPVALVGVRSRRLRTTLTALGIAIGIAALVAVLGISASSRADLLARIEALGPNRLQVRPGQTFLGEQALLPEEAPAMIRRMDGVEAASAVTGVSATVRRSALIPPGESGGISVVAAESGLADTVGATVAQGRFLDAATRQVRAVLGATAAERLGIASLDGSPMVLIDGQWWTVVGILDPVPLLGGLDAAAMVGYPAALAYLDADAAPSTVYVRTDPERVEEVRALLGSTANPLAPNEVSVARPSDAVEAREAVDDTLTALLLGLGAVALLVGGIGIANVMVVAVLERRAEIGVRRALGATRGHIRLQFLVEALVLAAAGGVVGMVLGATITVIYTGAKGLVLSLPPAALASGLGAALVVGALAGLSPAARAARLAPADALRPA